MLENLKNNKLKFELLIFLLLFYSLNVYAEKLHLKNVELQNLPEIYKDIFVSFFLENLNISKDSGATDVDVKIQWLSFNYNICFFIEKENKYFLENICFTSNSAENILSDLKKSLKNSKYLKFVKNIDEKIYSLKVLNPQGIVENYVNVVSEKGDRLTGLKKVEKFNSENGDFFTVAGASAAYDILVIPDNSSAFLLQKFLNGYKINKVYILK